MSEKFTVTFVNPAGPPTLRANPAYPDGLDVDLARGKPSCKVPIPYPAKERGTWLVACKQCRIQVAVTAAGRKDDPRSVRIPCKLARFNQ